MKRLKIDLEESLMELSQSEVNLKKITSENLDVDYGIVLPKPIADTLFEQLENSIEYLDAELSKVKVFGKWHNIPRQQVAYGDSGLKYKFSGVTVSTKPWIPPLENIKIFLKHVTGYDYNFVLVNRYRNGSDHIGEHRDDEKELDKETPIASLSLGQQRTFTFRHIDSRKKNCDKTLIPSDSISVTFNCKKCVNGKCFSSPSFLVKLDLAHGSILLMNPPTNEVWYHSLPPRKTAPGIRINLTFRKINI